MDRDDYLRRMGRRRREIEDQTDILSSEGCSGHRGDLLFFYPQYIVVCLQKRHLKESFFFSVLGSLNLVVFLGYYLLLVAVLYLT